MSEIVATLTVSKTLPQDGTITGKDINDDGQSQVIELSAGQSLRIGRSKSNDFRIEHRNVSRFHAVFSASTNGIILSDLSSLNGTFVNRNKISTPVDILSGDVVAIGDLKITVKLNHGEDTSSTTDYGKTQTARLTSVMVTVLLVDVTGYTKISEALPPADVAQMMRVWFQKMSEIVSNHGGVVDKYIGDCVMTLWRGSRKEASTTASDAYVAGLEMLKVTDELSKSKDWAHHDAHPWSCRVAMNTGEALMGNVGGAGQRDYTVLGDAVNVTFRLEDIASGLNTNFILSEATAELLGENHPVTSLGEFELDGRSEKVNVFSPVVRKKLNRNETVVTASNLLSLPIVQNILEILEQKLPPSLSFHSLAHTYDVFGEAMSFAIAESRSDKELELIAIAAAFHDAGFIKQMEDNEEIGAKMAIASMRATKDYPVEEINMVAQMILDTKISTRKGDDFQRANTELSPYLLDADVSNFGRDDFFERMDARVLELQAASHTQIYSQTLELMKKHKWQTSIARSRRQTQKLENMKRLEDYLKEKG